MSLEEVTRNCLDRMSDEQVDQLYAYSQEIINRMLNYRDFNKKLEETDCVQMENSEFDLQKLFNDVHQITTENIDQSLARNNETVNQMREECLDKILQ
ncbi:unnamed protein product [Moneuplotes crassus]|uniref:Uncharacterized protein n=1 Tax=Euplotes crassus TaxID=5936 RepID=A0AAD1Y2T2_EUPCR|nr:unnamed protein product [Moneuplotes crassus]